MHPTSRIVGPRLWLLAAVAVVVALVGVLPTFGGTAYAAGVNLNNSAGESRFAIPGTPVTRTTVAINDTDQFYFKVFVAGTEGFPSEGQILVSDGAWGDGDKDGAEIMTYNICRKVLRANVAPALGGFPKAITVGDPGAAIASNRGCVNTGAKKVGTFTLKQGGATRRFTFDQNAACAPFDPLTQLCLTGAKAPDVDNVAFLTGDLVDGHCGTNGAPGPTNNMKAGELCIKQRGPAKIPGATKKSHPSGSKVKMATTLTAPVNATDGPQTTLTDGDVSGGGTTMSATQGGCTLVSGETFATCPPGDLPSPFLIQLASTTGFPGSGFVSISHQDVQTSNQSGAGPGQSGESMKYDMMGAGANQIRIVRRAQGSTNRAYLHQATGYLQPGQNTTPTPSGGPAGVSKVSVHFQIQVKSNAGFFPAGNLMVCDPTNPLTNCELIGHNNASPKINTPAANEFHMAGRCAAAGTFNKVPGGTGPCTFPMHAINSIVTGADGFLHCRTGNSQPGVDTNLAMPGFQEPAGQVLGTSVGAASVCYGVTQPKNGPTKSPWPTIVGHDLIVINAIAGQPFLSTGGFCHVVLGAVGNGPSSCPATAPAPFDTDGPNGDANDCDADGNTAEIVLCLGSACIPDFTPGVNLQVRSALQADKTLLDSDTGTIRVVLDAIHDNVEGNADDCNDPAGTDEFISTGYDSATGEPAVEKDDDTDRDGCVDEKELRSILNQGGLRDPWNPYDWYDINHDGAVTAGVDVLQVAQSFGVPANYAARKDRGAVNYGPFAWNKSGPNNNINSGGDVLGVSQQFSSPCLHDPNTMTATHEGYDTGLTWPGGNRPWYCPCAGGPPTGVANHGP